MFHPAVVRFFEVEGVCELSGRLKVKIMTEENRRNRVMKIAIEEHFDSPGTAKEAYDGPIYAHFPPEVASNFQSIISDVDDGRIAAMDVDGIDFMVLSQTTPGVQIEKDAAKAARIAREANEFLAERIRRHPTRFGGFAHLALQDPEAAAEELERCVQDLGFVGAMINGHTHGAYLDEDQFAPFWERVVALDVPVYLHPADPYGFAARLSRPSGDLRRSLGVEL